MTKMHVPYLNCYRSRHGKQQNFFRRGSTRIRLPDTLFSEEFWTAYNAALNGTPRPEIGASRTVPGTFNAAVVAYYRSPEFRNLAASTQGVRRNILERFRAEHGDKRVKLFERRHLIDVISDKATSTPAAAQVLLKVIRGLLQFCVDIDLRQSNPAVGIRNVKVRSDGIYSWSEPDIAKFRAYHALGTRPRLALELALNTTQRRSDLVRMGWQHLRDGRLHVRQQKTGTPLNIPVHPELRVALDNTPTDNLTFLVTRDGSPFTPAGFGNHFREWCNEAGLPKACSVHGLRKAGIRRLAESGCTAHQIMSISGHKSLQEAQGYCTAVDQKQLAEAAMAIVVAARPGTRSDKPR
jgi:integrase